jgi:ribosome assembly protein 3
MESKPTTKAKRHKKRKSRTQGIVSSRRVLLCGTDQYSVSSDSDSEPERKEVKAQKEDENPVAVHSQPVNQPCIDRF